MKTLSASCVGAFALAALLTLPLPTSAAFNDSAVRAQAEVAQLSQQQLDSLNTRVFTDAFLAAKIVGYDPAAIDRLKTEMQQLRHENAELRALISARPVSAPVTVTAAPSGFSARLDALEEEMSGLKSTLTLVVNMLTMLLAKLQ